MGNLVLRNPSEQVDTVAALVAAVSLDEVTLASQGVSIAALQSTVPATEPANKVLAGPVSGSAAAPAFRSLVSADIPSVLTPTTLYSAAGTPLPTATTALKGASAVVSDATTPLYGAAYLSGGAVIARVLCTGSGWVTA